MEFLKEILGDKYPEFEAAIKAYNEDPENKDKQIKLANLGTGEYVGKAKYSSMELERDNYKSQLTTAQESLKAFEGVDVENLKGEITTLGTQLQNKETEFNKKLAEIEFNSNLETFFSSYKFTSDLAKKAAIEDFKKKEFKMDNGKFLGGEDFMKELKELNPTAFESEEDEKAPKIVKGTNQRKPGQKMTLSEAMKYANEHPEVDIKTLI